MTHGDLATLLAPGAKARKLDLQALLAISGHEGAGGGIGDGGHAFGPFQLNNAGGVLTGKFQGRTPEQINQWAWSPAGINYALDGIARVASGQHGAQAIKSIASQFERPANVGAEISDALAHYGKSSASAAPVFSGAPAGPSPAAQPGSNPFLGSLVASTNQSLGLGSSPSLAGLFEGPVAAALSPHSGSGVKVGGKAGQGQSGLPPLKPAGARSLASVGGVQVDPSIAGQVQQIIGRFGVHPTSGYRSADHNAAVGGAPHSDHLTGDAVDFGGNPSQLAALYKWSQGRYPYVEPWSQTGGTHDHISFRR